MGEDIRKEKEFSREIDSLLSGKGVRKEAVEDEDYGTALDFAGKIMECRVDPTDKFKNRLKGQLLGELARQEAEASNTEERRGSFLSFWGRLFAVNYGWRPLMVTAVFIALALVVVWRIGVFSPPDSGPVIVAPPASTPPGMLGVPPGPEIPVVMDIFIRSSRSHYSMGEEISLEIIFQNTIDEPLTIEPFPPEFHLVAGGTERPVIHLFESGDQILNLAPQESNTITLTWDQLDMNGLPVPPGDYTIRVSPINLIDVEGSVNIAELPLITITP